MNTLVKMVFGSHLYGTSTPESDKDFAGVFLPTRRDAFLGRMPKTINQSTKKGHGEKNGPGDIDSEMFSLQYFIKLALEGQTIAMDMLHAPADTLLEYHPFWGAILSHRHKFYTKNMSAFIGYARRQAAKYGIKGSRLNAMKSVLDVLATSRTCRLSEFWDELPRGEHCYDIAPAPNGVRQYQVCGKILQDSVTNQYAWNIVHRDYTDYGQRAIDAAQNRNIDWKAVSHAMRAAFQVKEIFTDNTITFPLAEAPFLLAIKQGKLDWTTEVAPRLESLMDEVEALAAVSTLPDTAPVEFWEDFIIEAMERYGE